MAMAPIAPTTAMAAAVISVHGAQGAGGEPGGEEGPRLAGLVAQHPRQPEHQEEDGDDGHDDADGQHRGGLQPDGPVGHRGWRRRPRSGPGTPGRRAPLPRPGSAARPRWSRVRPAAPCTPPPGRVEVRASGDVLAVVGGVEGRA